MINRLTVLLMLLAIFTVTEAQIQIDGDVSDWTASMQFDIAPHVVEGTGDSTDTNWDGVLDNVINPALDVKDIYVTHDDDYLYIRIDINEDGTFSDLEAMVDAGFQAAIELFIDTDVDTSTGLTWGTWMTSGDYWINLSVKNGWPGFELTSDWGIQKFVGATGTDSQWEQVEGVSCLIATNVDDNILEVAIPRAAIGETNGDLESTGILVLSEDPTAAWTYDVTPNNHTVNRNVYRYGQNRIVIDGDMSDWSASMQFDVDPNVEEGTQDSTDTNWDGVFDSVINPALDVKDIYVTHDDDYLYVRIDINEDGTFSDLESMVDAGFQAAIELFIDTDVDTSTGLTWGTWMTSGDYWINLSVQNGWPGFELTSDWGIQKFIGATGTDSQWEEVAGASCLIATNVDDNILEIAIPRMAIGETNGDEESTGILVLAEDPTAAWTYDVVPNNHTVNSNVYYYNGGSTSLENPDNEEIPVEFSLKQNYPNPFNPTTTINFSMKEEGKVNLVVYNILGQEVASLLTNKVVNAGSHSVNFNASKLSSGIYFYSLQTTSGVITKKMMLMK